MNSVSYRAPSTSLSTHLSSMTAPAATSSPVRSRRTGVRLPSLSPAKRVELTERR